MECHSGIAVICAMAGCISLGFGPKLVAYIDAGTGSYIIQLAIAGAMGGLFALKIYWGKIRSFFARRQPKEGEADRGDE